MIGRITSIQEEWVKYNCGWYVKSIPIILWKKEGSNEHKEEIRCWRVR